MSISYCNCLSFHVDLMSMTQAAGFGLVPSACAGGGIAFSNFGERRKPLEPVASFGPRAGRPIGSSSHASFEDTNLYADVERLNAILSRPLARYLPENDPRALLRTKASNRAWESVCERSVRELIGSIRSGETAHWSRENLHASGAGTIDGDDLSFVGNLIGAGRGGAMSEDVCERMLVSAILLGEVCGGDVDMMKRASYGASRFAEHLSEAGRHEGSAILYELAITMLPQGRAARGVDEVIAGLSARAAREWNASLEARYGGDTFLLRLFHGMYLAWDAGDCRMLWQFHNLHANYLEDEGFEISAAKARVRSASAELERLMRNDFDLGQEDLNRDAWETIGGDLKHAHSLFITGEDYDLAAEVEILSARAYLIFAEMSGG